MLGQAADAALSHPLTVAILAPLAVLGVGALVRSLLRISKAVTVEIPNQLTKGEARMTRIEDNAAELTESVHNVADALVAHMRHEEEEGREWRTELRGEIEALRLDYRGLVQAISAGDKVGRATEGDHE